MAHYLALAGQNERALPLSERACSLAERCDNPTELRLRQQDHAQRLLHAGYPTQTLSLLSTQEKDAPAYRATTEMLRAEAFSALDADSEAQDCLQRASIDIEAYELSHLRDRAEALMGRY